MSYTKQTFVNNQTVLTAEMMNHIEAGIVENENKISQLSEEKASVTYVEDLASQFKMFVDMMLGIRTGYYYATLNNAVNDVNAGTIGANAITDNTSAVACVYTDENGGKNVVLLKDSTEATRITASKDMNINLGGHTFATGDKVAVDVASGNITIDGRLNGSGIAVARTDGSNTKAIQLKTSFTGTVTVKGGTYIATATNAGSANAVNSCIFVGGGELVISDAFITMTDTGVGCCAAIANLSETTISVSNCNITATVKDSKSWGISNYGTANVTNSNVIAYSNYNHNEEGNNFSAYSVGVNNHGTLTINDCYAFGTHSGMSNVGTLRINGGTFEGYGHGGIYFSNTDSTAYVRDTILRDCKMPEGYTATANRNGAGFYLGDNTTIKVYMDNCDVYGISASQIFVIKTNDNALYISNSTINNTNGGDANIRIDDGNNKLYLGVGNNFTAENTNRPSAVVVTNEVYAQNVA